MDIHGWSKSSWRSRPIRQQPSWPDPSVCADIVAQISRLPALVFAGESRALQTQLARAARGEAFVLQCGDCAEEFSRCHGPQIHNLLKVILQMSIVLVYAVGREIVHIGRIAGQYAKPRSSDVEKVDGRELPVYRGDMINGPEPTVAARLHDPRRMLEGYFRAAATLNLVRAFTRGGYAALDQAYAWHQDFLGAFPANAKYQTLSKGLRKAIRFMSAIGLDNHAPQLNEFTLYTSHEALLLEYEEAMTRIDTTTGRWYNTSANMLWVGDRTRQSDGAHIEFLRGVNNPVGMKIGPEYDLDDIKRIAETLNPRNEPGRLSLITRFGQERIRALLPPLLRELGKEGFQVVWICDPMHGNTRRTPDGRKTRSLAHILGELGAFFDVHRECRSVAGGVHLELTGDHVAECTGGSQQILAGAASEGYRSLCDPRLNAGQAVELAFELAEMLNPDPGEDEGRPLNGAQTPGRDGEASPAPAP